MAANSELRISRIIDAPRAAVFRAWTEPDELKRWWGPGAFTTPYASIDLRPGGSLVLVMQPPEGDPLRLVGTYREVRRPERLVYTWCWAAGVPDERESLVTVEFREVGQRTEVVVIHGGFASAEQLMPYRMGWESGFDKLMGLLAPQTQDEPNAAVSQTARCQPSRGDA